MLNIIRFLCGLLLMVVFSGVCVAENYTVQEGRTIDVVLDTPVNTSTSSLNGYVQAVANQPFYDDGNYLLPAGTKLEGKITFIDKVNAAVKLNFYSIIKPNGEKIPVDAMVETKDGTGVLGYKKKSKASSVKKLFVGAGTKAAISAAETAAIKSITPGAIYNSLKVAGTVREGVVVAKDVKDKEYKKAGMGAAGQVVKYTPYGTAYKYGKSAVKGYKGYGKASKDAQAAPIVLVLEKGSKLEIQFLRPFVVKM